jgi:hypothetical protein
VAKPVAAPARKKPKVAPRAADRIAKRQNFERVAAYQSPPLQSGWPARW